MENEKELPRDIPQVEKAQSSKKTSFYYYLSIVIAGIVNTFVIPYLLLFLVFRTGILGEGIMLIGLIYAKTLIYILIVGSIILALVVWALLKKSKNYFIIFAWILLLSLIINYGGGYLQKKISTLSQKKPYTNISVERNFDINSKTKLIDTKNSKEKVKLVGDNVVWQEQTQERSGNLDYQKNIFAFSPLLDKKTAKTVQISDVSKELVGDIRGLAETKDGVYWIQGINLYFQPFDTSVAKRIIKEKVAVIDGSNDDYLLIEHAESDSTYGPTTAGLYLLNPKTGEERDLSSLGVYGMEQHGPGPYEKGRGEMFMSGDYICFVMKSDNLRRKIALYNIATASTEIKIDVEPDQNMANSYYGKSAWLDGFSGDFIQYILANSPDSNTSLPNSQKIFSISQNKIILENDNASGKIFNNALYRVNSDNASISKVDLVTLQTSTFTINVGGKKITDWMIDNGNIAYITNSSESGDEIWLEPIK